MNVVLIGYRGTGKTTVAEMLAAETGMPRISLDEEIVRRAGQRIPEIVERHGWEHFRDLESEVVREVSAKEGWIVDAGGGVILRDENVRHLRRSGFLIWLTAPPAVLIERIQGDTERPALKEGKTFLEEVEEVLAERLPRYEAAAHHRIDVSMSTPEQVAREVRRVYGQRGGSPSGDAPR